MYLLRMRLVSPRFTAILPLCAALLLISRTIPLLSHLTNHLLFFSLFNTLIFTILCASRGSSTNDASEGMHFSFLQPFSESEASSMNQEQEKEEEEEEEEVEDEYSHVHSDGYYEEEEEDDDVDDECDESSDDGMTHEYDSELEDTDDSLNTRIEDFIAKVTNGWKEENLREKRDNT